MTIRLYMDHHVSKPITLGLRMRGIDVITAYEDGTSRLDDADLLDRAGNLERVLFTQDDDLLAEAHWRQSEGIYFFGVIYAHQQYLSIGTCIRDLEIIAQVGEPQDLINMVRYLPL